jgi:putative addiction module component (TIGR02574 family)
MSPSLRELKAASSTLPASERAELAQFLLHSLKPETDEGWAAAWQEESARRLAEIRAGEVKGIPADEVLARLRERYP